jgi:putative CRISPR-associated protein (TIGR02619 family)
MARTIILPVGISVLRGLERHGVQLTPGHEAAQLTAELLESLGEAADELSAELSTLKALKASQEDQAVFLATDTDDSERAARINARITELQYRLRPEIRRVRSLGLDDALEFRKEGLPALFQELDRFVERAIQECRDPLLGVSGGIKPVVPYVAVYGMIRRVPVTYIFERTQELITLPPLPIDFDSEGLQAIERVLQQTEQEVAIERHRLESLLGEDFPRFEGLFEEIEKGKLTLSVFGMLWLTDLKQARELPVMLSPSVREKLEQAHGIEKKLMEVMLDRVRNPLQRKQMRHTVHGTDLEVYKMPRTARRLAGWVEGATVYIAELYTNHDEYLRHLPARRRDQYQSADFTPYHPSPEQEPLVEEEEETYGDELIAVAIREKARAEAEREEALKLAGQYDEELKKIRQETDELRKRAAKLEAEERARASWSLWRRLRWALFGS